MWLNGKREEEEDDDDLPSWFDNTTDIVQDG